MERESNPSLSFVSLLLAVTVLGMLIIELISGGNTFAAYIIGISIVKMLVDGFNNSMVGAGLSAVIVGIEIIKIALPLFAH